MGHEGPKVPVGMQARSQEIKPGASARLPSPDGRILAACPRAGSLTLLDARTGERIGVFEDFGASSLLQLQVASDRRQIQVTSTGRVYVWDAKRKQRVRQINVRATRELWMMTMCRDERGLVVGSLQGTCYLIDWQAGRVLREFSAHQDDMNALALSSDGQRLVTGGGQNEIKVWSTATWRELLTLHDVTGGVEGLAFLADDQTLVSMSRGGKIVLRRTCGATRTS